MNRQTQFKQMYKKIDRQTETDWGHIVTGSKTNKNNTLTKEYSNLDSTDLFLHSSVITNFLPPSPSAYEKYVIKQFYILIADHVTCGQSECR